MVLCSPYIYIYRIKDAVKCEIMSEKTVLTCHKDYSKCARTRACTHTHTHTHYTQFTNRSERVLQQRKMAAWEGKTWQVCLLFKKNKISWGLMGRSPGWIYFWGGRWRSFHVEGLNTEKAWERTVGSLYIMYIIWWLDKKKNQCRAVQSQPVHHGLDRGSIFCSNLLWIGMVDVCEWGELMAGCLW